MDKHEVIAWVFTIAFFLLIPVALYYGGVLGAFLAALFGIWLAGGGEK